MSLIQHLINGELVNDSGRSADVYNPSTGQVIHQVPLASRETIQQAIDSAKAAFPAWRNTPPAKRAQVMFRFKQLLEQNEARISQLISEEHGKTLEDAAGELKRGIENVEYACSAPEILKGEYSRNVGPNIDAWSDFQPLGVVAGITPFNFPAMVPMWMFPIALACGNTFVLKPPALAPSAAVRMAELLKEAGLPDGVFNVVHCANEDAAQLCTDPHIQAVSFVGSSAVAEHIYTTASAHGKRVQAFGAAKNQAIIMPDADLDATVKALMGGAFGSAGERCMALPVAVVVGDDTADKLIVRLKPLITQLRVGPGIQQGGEENEMGPLVSSAHQKKVLGYINLGVEEGATLVVDGRNYQVSGYPNGYYVGGTLFDQVKPNMRIYREEIFGPVLGIVRVPDYQTAIDTVNSHEFGNGSAIFTRNGHYARQFVQEVQAGMVGVNVPVPVPMAFHSFGGWKRSVFGALNVHGTDGVRFYTRMKTATVRWPTGQQTVSEYSMPTLG